MRPHPSYAALDLAMKMDGEDAARLLTLDGPDDGRRGLTVEPLQLEAARIVREWIDMYGANPSIH